MLDGPTSFVLMMGLLGSAVYGGFVLLVCLGAAMTERLRRHAIRSLIGGAIVGGLALAGAVILLGLTLNEGDREAYLFKLWGLMSFFARFAWGAAFAVVVPHLCKLMRTPNKAAAADER
jgi:hypothetical protein